MLRDKSGRKPTDFRPAKGIKWDKLGGKEMVKVFGGALIKKYREERGITLEELSDDICHFTTLHRIEKGDQSPNIFVFTRLVQRLGFESEKFFIGAFTRTEIDFFNLYYEAEALIMGGKFDEAIPKIDTLEKAGFDLGKVGGDKIREQMILVLKFNISQGNNEDPISRIVAIQNALRLTISNFNEEKISNYMLSYDEIALLNMLATAHGDAGNPDKEIDVLQQAKKSIDKYYLDKYEKSRVYTLTLFNLSSALGYAERHSDALEICDIAIKYCVEHKRLYLLPHLKFNKACALFYSGDKSKYRQLATDAIHTLINNEDFKDATERIKIAEEKLGLNFKHYGIDE